MNNPPIAVRPEDLELVFPDPSEALLPHSIPKLSWEQWMQECAERTNAYLKTYDRANDPTVSFHEVRFFLE